MSVLGQSYQDYKYIFRLIRNIVTLTYGDAASLLFGAAPFTTAEFRRRTGNPRAAKVLSDMKRRGLVARVARGRYRLLAPDERLDHRADEWRRARDTILTAGLRFAWTGSTAVEVWTAGGYVVSPSSLVREFHLLVPRRSLAAWEGYLAAHGVATKPRKRIGSRARLHAVPALPAVSVVGGEPVISRSEVLRLIRDHPAIYGGAEEWVLDRRG